MNRDTAALPRRQRLPPTAGARDKIQYAAQATGIDRVFLDRGIVVWVIDADGLQVDPARRPEQGAQIFNGIGARRDRKLVDERADRKGMRNIVDGAIPADANVIGDGAVFTADIRDGVRHIGDALLQLAWSPVGHVRLER